MFTAHVSLSPLLNDCLRATAIMRAERGARRRGSFGNRARPNNVQQRGSLLPARFMCGCIDVVYRIGISNIYHARDRLPCVESRSQTCLVLYVSKVPNTPRIYSFLTSIITLTQPTICTFKYHIISIAQRHNTHTHTITIDTLSSPLPSRR